jgi:DNA primase large subunit
MQPIQVLATYPFLDDAKQYIKEQNLTAQELLTGKLYERARTISIERLENALKKGDVKDRRLATETDYLMEIYSYPLARMLTIGINDPYMTRRYALAEAKHANNHLLTETPAIVRKIVEELNINFKNFTEYNVEIYFKNYLHNAPTYDKKWKLVNRTMSKGYVVVSYKTLIRLAQEALRIKIINELDTLHSNQHINTTFSAEITRFRMILNSQRKKMETAPIGKLSIEKLPPCLKDILSAMQSGENVPHMGRFSLVSFLNTIGMNTNEILKLFSTAPDYQEERTRYQVEHITGESSSTQYKSPGCQKMRTYGLCPTDKMNELCKRTNHPLSYYNKKWKQAAQENKPL